MLPDSAGREGEGRDGVSGRRTGAVTGVSADMGPDGRLQAVAIRRSSLSICEPSGGVLAGRGNEAGAARFERPGVM